MSFKKNALAVFHAPAKLFGGLTGLLIGDYARKTNGTIKNDAKPSDSLLGVIIIGAQLALEGVKFLGRTITNFIKNHQQAIATAFWASLIIAGAAALTVALWPAALAAVTGFAIGGITIASLVGTGFAAQVAATAGVAAVVTSAAVYTAATIANVFSAIKSVFTPKAPKHERIAASSSDYDSAPSNAGSAKTLSRLNTKPCCASDKATYAPVHTPTLYQASETKTAPQPSATYTAALR